MKTYSLKLADAKSELMELLHGQRMGTTLQVKIMCYESGENEEFDVEINAYKNDKYFEGVLVDTFTTEKEAQKRAAAISKAAAKWTAGTPLEFNNEIELYYG